MCIDHGVQTSLRCEHSSSSDKNIRNKPCEWRPRKQSPLRIKDRLGTGAIREGSTMKRQGEDSCHSWIILAACSIINFVTSGLLYGPTGVLYVAYQDTTGSSAERASWVIALTPAMSIIGGPLGAVLSTKFEVRSIIICGIILGTVGTSAAYLCLDVYYLIVFYGVMNGIGTALASTALSALINNAFDKYRETAMGIFCSVTPIAGAIMPVFTQTLYDQFGLQGTFLILGGVYLQAMIGAVLFMDTRMKLLNLSRSSSQEVPQDEKKQIQQIQLLREYKMANRKKNGGIQINNNGFVKVPLYSPEKNVVELIQTLTKVQDEVEVGQPLTKAEVEFVEPLSNIEVELLEPLTKVEVFQPSTKVEVELVEPLKKLEIELVEPTTRVEVEQPFPKLETTRKPTPLRRRVRTYSITGKEKMVGILKVPGFHLSNFTLVIGNFLCLLFSLITVDNGIQNGLDVHWAVHLMTIYSSGQLLGRIGLGWITERKFVSKPAYFTATHLIFGVVCLVFAFSECFGLLAFLSALSGVILGNLNPLAKVVYSDYLRKDQMVFAMYMSYFMVGVLAVIRSACVGQIRDKYGNYKQVYYIMAAISTATALVWAFEYFRKRRACNKI